VYDVVVKSSRSLSHLLTVAPEAVWQVWQPPYKSEIWRGGAIQICWNLGSLFSGISL